MMRTATREVGVGPIGIGMRAGALAGPRPRYREGCVSAFSVHPSNGFAPSRRRRAAVVGIGAVLAIGLALPAGSALAAPPTEFGAGGPGAGELNEPHGIAVEQQSGDIFLADRNNSRVDKFGPDGEFILAFGWGVADGRPELQTCTAVCRPGLEGVGAGQFELPSGIAVDNDPASTSHGDVYVGDPRNHRVEKFGPEGEFLLMVGGEVNATTAADLCLSGESCQAGVEGSAPGFFEGQGEHSVAVAPDGSLYVGDSDRVQKFSSGGVLLEGIPLLGAGSAEQLAIDSAGDLFVKSAALAGVREYDETGSEIGAPRDATGEPSSIAIGPADQLFVDDGPDQSHHLLGFDAAGEQISSFDSGKEGGIRGIAFSGPAGGLLVLNHTAVRFITPPSPGPFILLDSESATEIGTEGATVNASINPEGGEETKYRFEYGTQIGSYGEATPPIELTGGSFEDQPASAAITGLQTRTAYHYRVVASNTAGETTFGPDREFTTLPPVSILAESVSRVSDTTATLEAELNPNGPTGGYHFEYGPTTAYGITAPATDQAIGPGSIPVIVSAALEGLSPASVYHYRVVARTVLGSVEGPDQTFTTEGSLGSLLPDGRAWELVSPPDKHGAPLPPISEEGGLIEASETGDAITYVAGSATEAEPAGNRSLASSQVIATRGSSAWSNLDIATPNEEPLGLNIGVKAQYRQFASDLSRSVVEPEGETRLSPLASERTPYLREADGTYVPLVFPGNVPPGTHFTTGPNIERGPRFVTATPDLSHILLSSNVALSESALPETGLQGLYEWQAGRLELLSILPNSKSASSEGQSANAAYAAASSYDARGTISADGTRVVFETPVNGGLFLRDTALGKTVQLNAPQGGPASSPGVTRFTIAGSDDSRIYFTDDARLTSDSRARSGQPDLYLCEIEVQAGAPICHLTDVSVPVRGSEIADVVGSVIGGDTAATRIYFVANGALTEDAAHGDCPDGETEVEAVNGQTCDLYYYDSTTHHVTRVTTLSAADYRDWMPFKYAALTYLTGRVSPNGRFLAFMSLLQLTGYDNRDLITGAPDEEVFLYDSRTGALHCASCDPSGGRPTGVPGGSETLGLGPLVFRIHMWDDPRGLAGSIPGWTPDIAEASGTARHQSRYLSDSGRLFFNAADGLVPQDSNATEDVYEYEPPGVGDCSAKNSTFGSRSEGCVGLISSGTSPEESAFLDASESGDDVFFLTAAKLSSEDVDGAFDVYDAHVCSSALPCITPPRSPAALCSGEACQAATAPPGEPAPSSSTFVGPGNLKSKCAKGKFRKGGRCVKKQHKKAKKHGHKKSGHGKRHSAKKRTNPKRGGQK
jgi:hypothetical protein